MFLIISFICILSIVNGIRSFEFVSTPMTFSQANAFCESQFGTELATINSMFENSNAAAPLCGNIPCWIGLNDINTEGVFEWQEGTSVVFTNFGPNQPSDLGGFFNRDCVNFEIGGTGLWADSSCTASYAFLCNGASPMLFSDIQNSLIFNEFRTIDGTGNNLNNNLFGIHNGPIIRTTPNGFSDNMTQPAREAQSSGRIISNIVTDSPLADSQSSDVGLSNLAWVFGQFIDHELVEQTQSMEDVPITRIDETEICIEIPVNDPFFIDPSQQCIIFFDNAPFANGTESVQRAINIATAFIDGSAVYGPEPSRTVFLRMSDGTLNVSMNANGDINLPFNTVGLPNGGVPNRQDLFLAGDPRANENIALTAIHTLFVRNHNYLVQQIRNANPFLSGDELFEFARAVNQAQIQHIVYNEWLPAFYGPNMNLFINADLAYDATCDASISHHFSFVSFRVGHTFISDGLAMQDSNCIGSDSVSLLNAFTQPSIIENGKRVIDRLLTGLSCTDARQIDTFIIPTLRNLLQFGVNDNTDPMDLMAINIERARDDGITDYATLRQAFGLQKPTSFNNIPNLFLNADTLNRIRTAYNDDINVVDPIVGAFGEAHLTGAAFGQLIASSWGEQFQRLAQCDRFFYTRYLTDGLLRFVKSTTMRNIIQMNSNPKINFLPNHQFVFNAPGKGANADISFVQIRNSAGNLCLATPSTQVINNSPVVLFQCDGSSNAERWYYNTKSLEIIHSTGFCLSVRMTDFNNNINPGRIVLFECNGQPNQKWILVDNDTNRHITNFLGNCLQTPLSQSMVNGATVETSSCILSAINQNWAYFGTRLTLTNNSPFSNIAST